MIDVRFYDSVEDTLLRYAVIAAHSGGNWVFCRHRDRDTWEIPGGHREPGEEILSAARRELWEETGALDYTIRPVCAYSVAEDGGPESFGMLFAADVAVFDPELRFEIRQLRLSPRLPDKLTYPLIQPRLLREVIRRGFGPSSL